jgi:hypothetical protein
MQCRRGEIVILDTYREKLAHELCLYIDELHVFPDLVGVASYINSFRRRRNETPKPESAPADAAVVVSPQEAKDIGWGKIVADLQKQLPLLERQGARLHRMSQIVSKRSDASDIGSEAAKLSQRVNKCEREVRSAKDMIEFYGRELGPEMRAKLQLDFR